MIEYCERYFPLLAPVDRKNPGAGSKLQQLKAVEKMTRKKPPEFEFPEPDNTVLHILEYYYQIKGVKGSPITYQEIKAFSDLMAVDLRSWQIETIIKIDRILEGAF